MKGNEESNELYEKKYTQNSKIIDLPNYMPCDETLLLLLKRSNFVAKICKSCASARCDCLVAYKKGWNNEFSTKWIETGFPKSVEDLSMHEPYNNNNNNFDEKLENKQETLKN